MTVEHKTHPHEMTNSHIIDADFNYLEPATIDETISALSASGTSAKVMVGGTDLLTGIKIGKEKPKTIINLKSIPELSKFENTSDGGLIIGAAVTIHDIRENAFIEQQYQALTEACRAFGSQQIQIMGTIGGNVCNGSPAADTVPALLVFDAKLEIAGPDGKKVLPLEEFLIGPGKNALKSGEFVTSIILPPPAKGSISAFQKASRVADDLAKASIAIQMVVNKNTIEDCSIAFGSVAPTPIRIKRAEKLLIGKQYSDELLLQTGNIVFEDVAPITDIRSTESYRKEICKVMAIDNISKLVDQGKENKKAKKETKNLNKIHVIPQPKKVNSDQKLDIVLNINGTDYEVRIAPNELLLNVLRDKLGFTGAKYGCGLGECGACTVLMDNKAVFSCLVLAIAATGKVITTIEGLQASDGKLDPLQEDFIEEAAYQCGYCTPGFIMTAKSLIHENPSPTEDEIREYLKGNRCRCTGYASIMRAIVKSVKRNTQ